MNDNTRQDGIYPFPAGMQSREIETNGATIHVRVGGDGPAVVMLHGFGTTGDMWGHLANALIDDHTVIAPDLRGLGLSSKPEGGYDKKKQAADVWGVLDALAVDTIERGALCATRRDASELRPVPGVQPGRSRQQEVPCAGQASDAGPGVRWRSHLRPGDRRGAGVCRR
jgi:hypothetical protein